MERGLAGYELLHKRALLRWRARSVDPPLQRAAASGQATQERPRRLLVVEDNIDARQTLRTLLETLGHEVDEAADGEAGVAAALRCPLLSAR